MLNLETYNHNLEIFHSDEIYPVGKFIQLFNKIIDNNTPFLWISGEVSNLYKHKSGHIYFSIKDKDGVIRCTLFRLSARRVKFELKDGMQIMVYGKPSVYEVRGDLKLNVNNIEPIGIGSIELALKQLKEKLQKQGLFDIKHKKPINLFPKKIAVITSKTGAVVQDIIKVLKIRYPYTKLFIYDVNTQGDLAAKQIIRALNIADNKDYDTIIIARGGGSTEDLYIFNDEDLAINVFNAKTPIISSIGHEVDKTIIDLVADKSASTPSAAAMLISYDKLDLLKQHKILNNRLFSSITNIFSKQQKNFDNINNRFKQPNFEKNYLTINNYLLKLKNLTQQKINLENNKLQNINNSLIQNSPQNILENKQKVNIEYREKLNLLINKSLSNNNNKLNLLTQKLINLANLILNNYVANFNKNISALNHLSPLKVLSRGYSITLNNNQTVKSRKDVKIKDEIITKTTDGEIISKVIKC